MIAEYIELNITNWWPLFQAVGVVILALFIVTNIYTDDIT